METINPNSLYALGMLYGKGDIFFNDVNLCKLRFGIKYRRPNIASLRSDNLRRDTKAEKLSPSVAQGVFNEFADLSRIFESSFGVQIRLEPLPTDVNSWNKKLITLESGAINTSSKILKELFNQPKINSSTLQHVPTYLFNKTMSSEFVKAFLQGVCDSAGLPPSEATSLYGGSGIPRVQIELEWRRWYVPIEICRLFQRRLEIPIQMINWGHPNTRGQNSYRGQNHQFRIYAQYFKKLNFRMKFKKQELKNLLDRISLRTDRDDFYPDSAIRKAKNPPHKCILHNENDKDLPDELNNLHFTNPAAYQIYNILKKKSYPLEHENNIND